MDNKIYDESQTMTTETLAKDSVANHSRRHFTKTGLGVGAVIATLASQPVLGAVPYNCTISGNTSGNVSSHGQPMSCAIGFSANEWKNTKTHTWPSPFKTEQLFKNAGGVSGSLSDVQAPTTGKTLLQVLKSNQGNTDELAREVVAAMLNAQFFAPNFPLSVSQVKNIWNEVATTGRYTVKPGVVWNSEDVKDYLESLHDD